MVMRATLDRQRNRRLAFSGSRQHTLTQCGPRRSGSAPSLQQWLLKRDTGQQQQGGDRTAAAGLGSAVPGAGPAPELSAADAPPPEQAELVRAVNIDDVLSRIRGLTAILEWADLPEGLKAVRC